jgi:hypothetical protein
MTKDDKFEILDMIEDILTRCEETVYVPRSDGDGGEYKSYVDPEQVHSVVRRLKEDITAREEI